MMRRFVISDDRRRTPIPRRLYESYAPSGFSLLAYVALQTFAQENRAGAVSRWRIGGFPEKNGSFLGSVAVREQNRGS